MLSKFIVILVSFLFITLPIINSNLTEMFWFKLWLDVKWNFEFTKVMYFNILSSLIILLFTLKSLIKRKKIIINNFIYLIIITFLISSYFSISPYVSFFWNNSKSHSFIMFLNLIGLFIIFINLTNKEKTKILKFSLIWLILSCIIAIWQLFYPSFHYWNLWNRAFWTFWHPNYLALYLLLYIPILKNNKLKINRDIKYIILILVITTLFYTKSIIAITILAFYLVYYSIKKINKKNRNIIIFLISIIFIVSIFSTIYNFWYTKLHSFFSRFFIWETTIKIITNSIKTILFGNWFETLNLVFEKNKSPFLYLFENIGFWADRPHNIFLNFFYSNWILWLIIIFYILKYIFKSKNNTYKESLILAFIFLFFNFASISSYLLIILLLSFLNNKKEKHLYNNIILIIISFVSIYWAYNSYTFYKAENLIKHNKILNITNIYKYYPNYYFKNWKYKQWLKYSKLKTELYYKSKIYYWKKFDKDCIELTNNYPSVENYFFCWNLYWWLNKKDIAKTYYSIGLTKLPDLRNKNSKYYSYKIIQKTINWNRFFSPKYSNLLEILKRTWIKK
jgi:hypothetical protein